MNRAKIFIVFTFFIIFSLFHLLKVNAQEKFLFPNELDNFKFYGKGKLQNLKLTISKSEDWKNIFGKICVQTCDLDKDWKVSFRPIDKDFSLTWNDGKKAKKLLLNPKFAGTLWEIWLIPKKRISLKNFSFPDVFGESEGSISKNSYNFNVYRDSDGLSYWVISQDTKDNKYKKGDLHHITYEVAAKIESIFFTSEEQKN